MGIKKFFNFDKLFNYPKYNNPFIIEIGSELIPMAEKDNGEELIKQIQSLRKNLSKEKGITVPTVRIVDNAELEPNQYRITASQLGEANLHENEYSETAGVITKNLKDIIVRLYERKE